MRIVHVAPLHERYDVRVFQKQCLYLARIGYDVTLVTADGKGDETVSNVTIVDVDVPPVGPKAYARACWRAMHAARRFNNIHFHDGFFLPFALLLALSGKSVIYDVHEDYRKVALGWKTNAPIRWSFYAIFSILEFLGNLLFVRAVAATPSIAKRFSAKKCSVVQNFPILSEVTDDRPPTTATTALFCYAGGISLRRGAKEMAAASRVAGAKWGRPSVVMAGPINQTGTNEAIASARDDGSLVLLGQVSRGEVYSLMNKSRAGLLLFHAEPNHVDAQPNKFFEYMAAGLPVIASDFPLWRSLIEEFGCGLVVDPTDVDAIVGAMEAIVEHPGRAEEMGRKGRSAVLSRLNWEHEFAELLMAYRFSNWSMR